MKLRRSTIAMLASFSALCILASISLFVCADSPEGKRINSSLIKRKESLNAETIIIETTGDPFQIHLEKNDGKWWLLVDGERRYPARDEKVDLFLEDLSKKRRMVLSNPAEPLKPEISRENGFSVRITGKSPHAGTELFFGMTNAAGTERLVGNDKNAETYRIDNEISQYLDTRGSQWADLEIFGEYLAAADIQYVRYEIGKFIKEYYAGRDAEIPELERALVNLRCIDITNIPIPETETLHLEMGDGKTVRIGLAPLGDIGFILTLGEKGAAYIISTTTIDMIRDVLKVP